MYRIDDPSASSVLPAPEAALTEGYWTEGNPGSGIPATLERASWFNMIQEELRAIVVAAGLPPSKTTYNQVLLALRAPGVCKGQQTFTSGGFFTVPDGVTKGRLTGSGGGGGGASNTSTNGGGGGGSGASCLDYEVVLTPGAVITVTIGAAGAAGTAGGGGNGGTTSFGAIVALGGGTGGSTVSNGGPGGAVTGSGSGIATAGQIGQQYNPTGAQGGGDGGSSLLGAGGVGGGTGTSNAAGGGATGFGAGGGGGAAASGAAGTIGILMIKW